MGAAASSGAAAPPDTDSGSNQRHTYHPYAISSGKNRALVNSLNEIQLLDAHVDMVRFLVKIDSQRFASAADDGDIVIWNHLTGSQLLRLSAHSRPVTALRLLDPATGLLVSGSSDRRVRLWRLNEAAPFPETTAPARNANADSATAANSAAAAATDDSGGFSDAGGGGEHEDVHCLATLTAHSASVTCLEPLEGRRFVSGGNDRQLIVWSFDGTRLGTIERQEEENLLCLLNVGSDRVVSSSATSSLLLVYDTRQFAFHKLLASTEHREAVHCLERVDRYSFASGSMDGTVLVWASDTLVPLRTLYSLPAAQSYVNDLHMFICPVVQLTAIANGRFLVVVMGHGVRVFELASGECTAEFAECHAAPASVATCLYHNSRIVSASIDGSLRLTALAQPLTLPDSAKQQQQASTTQKTAAKPPSYAAGHEDQSPGSGGGDGFGSSDSGGGSSKGSATQRDGGERSGSGRRRSNSAQARGGTPPPSPARLPAEPRTPSSASKTGNSSGSVRSTSTGGFFAGLKSKLQSPATAGGWRPPFISSSASRTSGALSLRDQLKKFGCAELGDMWVHSDSINCVLALTETSFASCGSDGLVILWKDGLVEGERRDIFARQSLQASVEQAMAATNRIGMNLFAAAAAAEAAVAAEAAAAEAAVAAEAAAAETANTPTTMSSATTTTTATTATTSSTTPLSDLLHQADQQASPSYFESSSKGPEKHQETLGNNKNNNNNEEEEEETTIVNTKEGSESETIGTENAFDDVDRRSIEVPDYLVQYAKHLQKEKQMTIDQVRQVLCEEGHSEKLVESICKKL